MVVRRHLRDRQTLHLGTADLAERPIAQTGGLSRVHRHATAQVGQGERGLAVFAVRGAENREQRHVLIDRKDLAAAQRPAAGREVAGEHHDLANEGL